MSFAPPQRPRAPARNTVTGSAPSTPSSIGLKGNVVRTPSSSSPRSGTQVASKRGSPRNTAPRPSSSGGSPERPLSRSSVSVSLVREIEEKEALLVKVQEQEAIIAALNTDSKNFISSLTATEARVREMDAEQVRMEDELVAKNEVAEKLRSQIRELEKERRDLQKRYNEQTQTFESERQSFYDNEQHLKSRIQNLSHSRRSLRSRKSSITPSLATETNEDNQRQEEDQEEQIEDEASKPPADRAESLNDDEEHEPPEITAMKLELSTLATSYASLQGTLQLLQVQLADLQRVNKELQEENESYNILLMEKTISGQYELLRRTVTSSTSTNARNTEIDDGSSLHGMSDARSNLKALPIVDEVRTELEIALAQPRPISPPVSVRTGGGRRIRRGGSMSSGEEKGETLGDLPITGPGLDLAAELGRAENKDHLDQIPDDPKEPSPPMKVDVHVVEALRSEVKSLKDANKALNLYASKILDRILTQGGFEHVLAADYESNHEPTSTKVASSPPPRADISKRESKPPIQSTRESNITATQDPVKITDAHGKRASKKGLSLDWGRLWPGVTASAETAASNESIQPSGDPPKTSIVATLMGQTAKKLDHEDEDEEDRILRERIKADMRQHGIEKEFPSPIMKSPTPSGSSLLSPATANLADVGLSTPTTPTPSFKSRLPFFGQGSSSSSSRAVSPPNPPAPLTSEALQQAEAETNLAVLDARERELAEEIAKGRPGGFTEIHSPRPGSSLSERHRSRRSGGSGHSVKSGVSTLFSAGRASMEGGMREVTNQNES